MPRLPGSVRAIGAAFAIAALAAPMTARADVAPQRVFGTPKDEFHVAVAPGWFVYTQAPLSKTAKTILYAVPDGGERVRVNPSGTVADYPSVDLGNPSYGDVVAFSQADSPSAHDDIRLYDLALDQGMAPPDGVNTGKSERSPLILDDMLVFGRGPVGEFMKKLIVVDLTTEDQVVLDRGYYILPGALEGDWLTWERCTSVCTVFRYERSTTEREKVDKQKPKVIPYSPVITENGTVYYLTSGPRCGRDVRVWRDRPGPGGLTRVGVFPRRVDGWLGDVEPSSGGRVDVFFARTRCSNGDSNIWRFTD